MTKAPGTHSSPAGTPKRRGRPPTGQALDSTARNNARRDRVRGDGGQVLTALLDAPAAAALQQLRRGGVTVDAAVRAALLLAAAQLQGAGTTPAATAQPPQQ